MQNLLTLWMALSRGQRIAVAAATLGVFLAVLALTQVSANRSMALLYSGLDPAAAGEVVAALDQRGVPYRIEGEAIHVAADQRDSLRMALAAEGLPAQGTAGYELLDGLSGFGTTAQMFDAAFWRAREGELARTILATPSVRAVRVHIGAAPSAPFRNGPAPGAAVTVTAASPLSEDKARAIRHLVAAAVPGLAPEDVAVIDSTRGLIGPGSEGPDTSDRAEEIRRNVERLLAARVGPGRAVVEVSVELVTESESITERRFDPQGRVAISSETEEKTGSSTEPGGQVTVASNLPEGDAAEGAAGQSRNSETRERVNYEVSETQREILRAPGAVRRLSVAVLVDGVETAGADGTVALQPRDAAELADLRELVASAVGHDEARGDVLTIKSLPFRAAPDEGTVVEAGLMPWLGDLDATTLVQSAILAVVALVLGLFVLRPLLLAQRGQTAALPAPAATLALPPVAAGGLSAEGVGLPGAAPTGAALTGTIEPGPGLGDRAGTDDGLTDETPAERLRRLIELRQAESLEILRGWMEQDEARS